MSVPARPAYSLYQILWTGLDWLYPPICGGCGKRGKRWCLDCQRNTQVISPPVCQLCGQSLKSGRVCARCLSHPPAYTVLRSWAAFAGPLRQALHRLKYSRDIALGEALARHLVDLWGELGWTVDLVTPVPLSVERQAQRGYNQAALLARPFALALGLSYQPGALSKLRDTVSQVGLSFEQRRENVHGAFQSKPKIVSGQSVLVLDDVTTSGSTLDACAQALLDGGARQVSCLTLARAV